MSHGTRRCEPPFRAPQHRSQEPPLLGTIQLTISFPIFSLHPGRCSDLDSLGQGNVSLVIHSEADAWESATGKEEGDPVESNE